jgi:hypothetical protein
MSNTRLTSKQKRLVDELDRIFKLLYLDYHNIGDYEADGRTSQLELARDHIIRGDIILFYTLIDEYLNNEIARYYFGKNRFFQQLWKTKRFQLFNYHILEELHLMQKLRHVKAITKVPKHVSATIEKMNALRNGLAHSFFPENLSRSSPTWKGKNIFSYDGIESFRQDVQEVINFFMDRY